jgi:hypothetical protein
MGEERETQLATAAVDNTYPFYLSVVALWWDACMSCKV